MADRIFLPSAKIVGPFLRFNNYDPDSYKYSASVLVVVNPLLRETPSLQFEPVDGKPENVLPILLDTYSGFKFWRFNLTLPLLRNERGITYYIECEDLRIERTFFVPGRSQTWHWMFYSCNGFHDPAEASHLDNIQPLWQDINRIHREKPFHVQVGGGDQIYNDPVWKVPALLQWLEIPKDERTAVPPTQEMTVQTTAYYFNHYAFHFSEPEFSDALAQIPYVFAWDDHDIFDGYGSYPDYLQNCAVFNMVYAAAKRFYLLFQQHANEQNAHQLNNCWGSAGGFNEIKRFGSSVAMWVMDNRSERSIDVIVAPGSHEMGKQKLLELGPEVRHVIILATVPVVYPELPAEAAFQGVQNGTLFFGLFNKSGLAQGLLNQFGEPDLLDDIIDHWTAQSHQVERTELIRNMQEVAFKKKVRVSFISGDVHSAGIGRFYSYPKHATVEYIDGEECEDFRDDPRFMPNITSSAIGNTPMPLNLVTAYNKINTAANVKGLGPTREKMVRRFRGKNDKVYGNRNYCIVEEKPYNPSYDGIENGALNFTLRGENRKSKTVDFWHNWVPMLTSSVDLWKEQRSMPDPVSDAVDE